MNKGKSSDLLLILALGLVLVASSCQPKISQAELQETAVQEQFKIMEETAIFETSVVEMMTEIAPTITQTFTLTPTITDTPVPSATFTITPTVYKNPWVLQDECQTETPSPCIQYSVENRSNKPWLLINLTHQETGDQGEFSVGPKSTRTITLMPGTYIAIYYATCDPSPASISKTWEITSRIDSFWCTPNKTTLSYVGGKD